MGNEPHFHMAAPDVRFFSSLSFVWAVCPNTVGSFSKSPSVDFSSPLQLFYRLILEQYAEYLQQLTRHYFHLRYLSEIPIFDLSANPLKCRCTVMAALFSNSLLKDLSFSIRFIKRTYSLCNFLCVLEEKYLLFFLIGLRRPFLLGSFCSNEGIGFELVSNLDVVTTLITSAYVNRFLHLYTVDV